METLTKNLTTFSDYYMKNFIPVILGIIAKKEQNADNRNKIAGEENCKGAVQTVPEFGMRAES